MNKKLAVSMMILILTQRFKRPPGIRFCKKQGGSHHGLSALDTPSLVAMKKLWIRIRILIGSDPHYIWRLDQEPG
jgi:hypothetical protein